MFYDYHSTQARDDDAQSEACTALMSSIAFGVISNEQAFYDLVRCYDALLGRVSAHTITIADITNDNSRSWYLYMTASLLHATRFTTNELLRVVTQLKDKVQGKKDKKARARSTRSFKYDVLRADMLESTIMSFCQHPDFEPVWHMRKRGDTRRLPTAKGKDLWGFLCRLYTDPEYCRMRVPDNIKKLYPMYPGYEKCVRSAIKAGQNEMKRIYGEDVDLSPVTDIKSKGEVDYDDIGASFISLLRRSN